MFGWFSKGGPQNLSGHDDADVTQMLQAATTKGDQAGRAAMYRQIQVRLAQDLPVLFLAFPETIRASDASLTWDRYADGAFRLRFAHFA